MINFILANKEFLKLFYALVVLFICSYIVLKTDRMFKLSDYQGIRYFRNSFFFYGLAFFFRFIFGAIPPLSTEFSNYIKLIFEFFVVVAGLFLLYSLIWKRIEKEKSHHSFINLKAIGFYVVSIGIGFSDFYFQTSIFMYISQIILFLIMSFIGYKNFIGGKGWFLKYYFIILVLGFFVWILNALLEYYFNWNKFLYIGVYLLNFLFFLVFVYAVRKLTGKENG